MFSLIPSMFYFSSAPHEVDEYTQRISYLTSHKVISATDCLYKNIKKCFQGLLTHSIISPKIYIFQILIKRSCCKTITIWQKPFRYIQTQAPLHYRLCAHGCPSTAVSSNRLSKFFGSKLGRGTASSVRTQLRAPRREDLLDDDWRLRVALLFVRSA